MSILAASWLVFLLLVTAGCSTYAAVFGTFQARRRRFEETILKLRGADSASETGSASRASALINWATTRMPAGRRPPANDRVTAMLGHAGFYRPEAATVFRLARGLTSALGVLAGLLASCLLTSRTSSIVLLMLVGFIAGAGLPGYLVKRRARRRQRRITRQLSDVLDLLVVCVEAGLGLYEAIKIVGQENDRQQREIGSELMMVSMEVAAGGSLGPALRNLAERTAVDDLRPLASTLIQSEQLGAQIGPALRSISDMIRTKRRLRAEEAAQKTTIKILFPLVLFILPAMLMLILAPALIQAFRAFAT